MTKGSRPWYSVLYVQVLIAIVIGILVGYYFPETGKALTPLKALHETMAHPITVGEELEELPA